MVIQEAWIGGVSTRRVDELVQAMGLSGISKSQVSKLCKDIDERVGAFLDRPIDGEWPYLWLDATYLKVRDGGRIVSVAAIIAVAVTTEGRREIVGLGLGPSEAEPFWSAFLKGLVKRGLKGVKLVISDAHDGLRHAITRVLGATWQRCRVHWMRNALAHVPKGQHTMVAAAIRQAFLQTNAEAAHQTWRHVADQLRPRWPKLAALMDDSETTSSPTSPSRPSIAPNCTAPTRSSASTRRSSAAPMLSASFPTRPASPGYRRRAARAERRVAAPMPLHADRGNGRTYTAAARRRARQTSTPGRLIDGHLKLRSDLHQLDGVRSEKLTMTDE